MVTPHPMRIPGAWRQGYVLDYHTIHSEFLGYDEFGNPMFDTKRTEVGEFLYQLKYRRNLEALDALVKAATKFVKGWRVTLDVIVPVPPTKVRRFQPVFEIATRLANGLGLPFRQDCVRNVKNTNGSHCWRTPTECVVNPFRARPYPCLMISTAPVLPSTL